MKSLSELIAELEAYPITPSTINVPVIVIRASDLTDAIQYLKMYKDLADDSESYANWKENPPLTWQAYRKEKND